MSDETAFNFTKRAIDALPLPAAGQRATYRDTKTPGLQLRITSAGVKTFVVFRRVNGKPERITLGKYPAMTIEQARARAADVNADIAMGVSPAAKRRADKADMPFAAFWKEYLERHARIRNKPRTVHEAEKTFRNYLSGLAGRKLSEITKADCQRLHHTIAKRTSGPTANRVLAVLSSAMSVAHDWGYLPGGNPAKGVKKFRERPRDRFLHADELPRFWQALLEEPNRDLADFFMVALLTGARRANVLAMRWEDVSLERAEWKIPETKNGEALTVPLVAAVVTLLSERRSFATGEWVFPGQGKTGHLVEPKSAWRRILARAGIEDLRVHDLRRTLGSSMAAAGVNTITTARTLGHKTLTMALRYQHLGTDPRRAAIEAGAGAILASAGVHEAAEVITLNKRGKT
ncbi:tyrosine-type recombinase/integrase [Candidatus Methylocalor cossyra]|uniref:Recombinase XerD n=1 Tax=Candidatus Methylocalor cossyra TaxID=3108543 RepID=A0ABP1CCF2_9GAMM